MPESHGVAEVKGGQPVFRARVGATAEVCHRGDEEEQVGERNGDQQAQPHASPAQPVARHQPKAEQHPERDFAADDQGDHQSCLAHRFGQVSWSPLSQGSEVSPSGSEVSRCEELCVGVIGEGAGESAGVHLANALLDGVSVVEVAPRPRHPYGAR